jgi:hypothetical protein
MKGAFSYLFWGKKHELQAFENKVLSKVLVEYYIMNFDDL